MRYLVVLAALLSLTKGYEFFYDMIEKTSLPMKQKMQLDKNCRKDVQDFHQNEENIKKYRFRSHWVQSNPLTDKIGYNFRKKETMVESIKKTMSTYSRKKRQATNNEDIQKLLNSIGQSCEKGEDVFKGSFTSEDVTCNPSDDKDVYRRLDGVCNNLEDKNKGAAGTAMSRLAEPDYADGIFAPRQLSRHVSPREISNSLHRQTEKDVPGRSLPETRKGFTHMSMQFGQMLDHDITLTPQGELECCNATFRAMDKAKPALFQRCLNIPVPANENPSAAKCLPFTRSDVRCTPGQPRQQFNGNTAFIDGSLIYGSDEQTASRLRKYDGGLMIVSDKFEETNLPTRSQCGFESFEEIQPGGFFEDDLVAGDVRAIVQPTMASIHTLFLAEHNRIARELQPRLAKLHPKMSPTEADELIYQQTRAVVGAELQQIVYEEYLPVVLGQQAYRRYGLDLKTDSAYDPSVDPSILNEFSTVAFRFGHSTVSDRFDGNPPGWNLKNQFFKFDDFAACVPNERKKEASQDNNGDCWISEMHKAIEQPSAAGDLLVGEALRENLFNASSARFGDPIAEDLVARNIQRAREHGIPSYGDLRIACGMKALNRNERPDEINHETWNNILKVYHSAADIDPFTGGLAETSPEDGIVGPLFSCIIGKQFQNLRDGDRYFFTHSRGPYARGLGENTKRSILKRSFGDILCDNQGSDIDGKATRFPLQGTQKRVFSENSTDNEFIKCNNRVSLDFDGIVSDFNNKKDCVVEVNTNYPGLDLNLATGRNVDRKNSVLECRDFCNEHPACAFFEWKKQSRECWMKTGISRKRAERGTTAGSACREVLYVEVDEIIASSTFDSRKDEYGPQFAIDGEVRVGNKDFLHTKQDTHSWAQLKLSDPQMVAGVEIFNRVNCCGDRLSNLEIRAGLDPVPAGTTGQVLLTQNERVGFFAGPGENGGTYHVKFSSPKLVQFITLQLMDKNYLQLNEVKVIASGKEGIKDLLFLGDRTLQLPSFSLKTGCSAPAHPLQYWSRAVSQAVDGSVMFCGGYGDGDYQSSCYSIQSGEWKQEPSMIQVRDSAASSIAPGGMLVTGGGRYSTQNPKSTEFFTDKWVRGPDMPNGMYRHCQTTVGTRAFVTGGYYTTDAAYMLEDGADSWTVLPKMKTPRFDHICVEYRGELMVIGGGTDESKSGFSKSVYKGTSVEILNMKTLQWRNGPELPSRASTGHAIVYKNVLYILYYVSTSDVAVKRLNGDHWEDVTNLSNVGGGYRGVFSALLVSPVMIGC